MDRVVLSSAYYPCAQEVVGARQAGSDSKKAVRTDLMAFGTRCWTGCGRTPRVLEMVVAVAVAPGGIRSSIFSQLRDVAVLMDMGHATADTDPRIHDEQAVLVSCMCPTVCVGKSRGDASCLLGMVPLSALAELNEHEEALAVASVVWAGCSRSCMHPAGAVDLSLVDGDSALVATLAILSWGFRGRSSPGAVSAAEVDSVRSRRSH
jgi:hypothetical protein